MESNKVYYKLYNYLLNGAVQIVVYVDEIAVLMRNRKNLKDMTTLIEKEANKRGLSINEYETKYMMVEKGRK